MTNDLRIPPDGMLLPSTNGRFQVLVYPAEVTSTVGTQAFIRLTILSKATDTFQVQFQGLATDWVSVSQQTVDAQAETAISTTLTIHPPHESLVQAGVYPCQIQVFSDRNFREMVMAQVAVIIPAYYQFSTVLEPQRQGQRLRLIITNQSNTTETFSLEGHSPEFPVKVRPSPAELSLRSGEAGIATLEPRPEKRPFFGRRQFHGFIITVKPTHGSPQHIQGETAVSPYFPAWLLTIFALVGIGLLIGGLFFRYSNAFGGSTPVVEVTITPFAPPETFTPTGAALGSSPASVANCEEPLMPAYITQSNATAKPTVSPVPGVEAEETVVATLNATPPVYGIHSNGFIDLPFPYEDDSSSSTAQFQQASRTITTYFDHLYPLYPRNWFPQIAREPETQPIGGNYLRYSGQLFSTDYSGHPGYDFLPLPGQENSTPVLAVADGVVDAVYESSNGLLVVQIRHPRPEGNYLSRYLHLQPDQYFNALRPGQSIKSGDRIGTMGNTGGQNWGMAVHLHFEMHFDQNGDGDFAITEKTESVDPFGFIPSVVYPEDPWANRQPFPDLKNNQVVPSSASQYLWIHSSGSSAQVPDSGGGQLNQSGARGGEGGSVICVSPGTLPAGTTVNWSWVPDPPPTNDRVGVGQSCVLSMFDTSGQPITRFNQPIQIAIPYDENDLVDIDPSSLSIYWADPDGQGPPNYRPLPTTLDADRGVAVAFTDRPGFCVLAGRPTRDIVPPRTGFLLDGSQSVDGTFYDEVHIFLTSDAPDLDYIEFSQDGAKTWERYTDPIVLTANGIPDEEPEDLEGETFIGGPGRFLLLARSYDRAGNVEEPPAFRQIYIDPSQAPETPTTPTATPTRESSPTPTLSPTPQELACKVIPSAVALWEGPGTANLYEQSLYFLAQGDVVKVIAGNSPSGNHGWYNIELVNGRKAWVDAFNCQLTSDLIVPFAATIPPTFTPTPTATHTPTPTPTLTPTIAPVTSTSGAMISVPPSILNIFSTFAWLGIGLIIGVKIAAVDFTPEEKTDTNGE